MNSLHLIDPLLKVYAKVKWYYHHLILFLFAALICLGSYAADTLHVRTHDRQTVVTDPSKGFHLYKAWGVFPKTNIPIRKIIMRLTLGCPDGMRCADWDYKDQITIRRIGGINGVSQDYEIARMLTPYGGAFGKDWTFDWEVDVTDFSLLLRDSVEIEYNHNGYEPNEDRGWSVTLDFKLIKGQPAWQPISIQKVYDGAYRYGDSSNTIENALKPFVFNAAPQADFARLRVVQTGHGMDKPDGCGEFCNKFRELWYDGKLMEKKAIWKHCGDNPLYPQAGTWVYDRAAWCPGNLMQPDLYDLRVKGGSQHTVDINMQHYVSSNPSADEVISAYLVQYQQASSPNDVAIEDVIKPSLKPVHRRLNPSGLHPQVVVKNMGSTEIKSLRIQFGTKGFPKKSFQWKGSLAVGNTTTITLPGVIDSKAGKNSFEATVSLPNGRKDGYVADNQIVSSFETLPRHDSMVVVYLQTNNEPAQNGYRLTNSQGGVVRERPLGSLKGNTVYRDTLLLPQGHYEYVLTDTTGDGLEFWANPRGGRGKARLLNGKGQILKDFESDFGSSVQYNFEVGSPAAPVTAQTSFGLYPTRTNDKTTFDYYANYPEDVVVRIVTDPGGDVVEEHHYKQIKEGMFTYDLSRYPKGRFYLSVWINGAEKFKKRIRLKE